VTIEGHADDAGAARLNLEIAQRRAEAVRRRLIELGVRQERIHTVAYGRLRGSSMRLAESARGDHHPRGSGDRRCRAAGGGSARPVTSPRTEAPQLTGRGGAANEQQERRGSSRPGKQRPAPAATGKFGNDPMTSIAKRGRFPLAAMLWLAAVMAPASVPAQQGQPGRAPPAPKAAPQPARDPGAAGDAALRQRVEQLEEQLVDMQVVVGTLESLARGATAPAAGARPSSGPAAAISAADAGRLDSIETQIRALAAQLEQLQEQVRALGVRNGALAQPSTQAANDDRPVPRPGRPQVEASPGPAERTGFGSVTVSPDAGPKDEIDRILNAPPPSGPPPYSQAAAPAPAPEAETANPKQLYETAYGYLLQRDYGAAEAAFD